VRLWPFGRKSKQEHYLGEYTEPTFRGALLMLVISVVIVALVWLAYSWALNHPGVHDPNDGAIERVTTAIEGLRLS
jgi:nitrogen fixation-related uncharacterized protein